MLHAETQHLKCRGLSPQIAVIALILTTAISNGNAQVAESPANAQSASEQRLATDRKTSQVLRSFRRQLAAGNISAAMDDLDILRASDPHSLVASNYPHVFVPVFRAVFDATYEIPEEQRKSILQTESNSAQLDFAAILAESQPEEIPALILRSAGTSTAVDAHFVAARLHLLRGSFTAARSWLLPLAHGHMPEEIRVTAAAILKTLPSKARLTTDTKTESTTNKPAELPKHLTWQVRSSISPKLQRQIETFLKAAHSAKTSPQTVWQDRVENEVVYRRSLRGLKAIDLKTGATDWEYPVGSGIDSLILSDRANSSLFQSVSPQGISQSSFAVLEKSPLANAFCRNNSLGRITADSQQLYLVTNSSTSASQPNPFGRVGTSRSRATGPLSSKLIAVDKATGRRVWSMGQSTLEESLGVSPAGCWIAGPPATHGRSLYSVFEWNGEMRLGCIATATGELQWSTGLSYPEQSIDKDGFRKFWAATPVCKEGLVWCPTTTGWLICVDEITRSVIYASGVEPDNLKPIGRTIGRNQPVVFTQFASLKDRWTVPRLIPSQDRIAIISHEARDIVVIDAVTGEQQKKIVVASGEFCVHCDETQIVLADAQNIRAVQTVTGEELWQNEFDKLDTFPIGPAAFQGKHLSIPMSDGSVTLLNAESGDIVEESDLIIPTQSWGRLESLPGSNSDLLYIAPDRISRLSANEPYESPSNPLEIASGLMAAGKWEQALSTAKQVPKSDPGHSEAESIIFASRLQLAAADPTKYLEQLAASELTTEQSLQVQIFKAATAFNNGKHAEAATHVVNLLIQEPTIRVMDVPPIASLWDSKAESNSEEQLAVQQTLLTWTSARFFELAELAPDSIAQDRLSKLTDDVVLAINHPVVLTTIHRRMKDAESEELFWHLLQQAVSIQRQRPKNNFDIEVELANARHGDTSTDLAAFNDAMRLLLAVSYRDTSPEFQACINALQPTLTERAADLNASLSGSFSQWNADTYKPLPVSRSQSTSKRVAHVDVAEKEDGFLGEFNWSVVQGDAGRLIANRLAKPDERLSIAGNFQAFSNYSLHVDVLHRSGTVILLKTSNGLTAISALDQRILWTRTPQGSKRTGISMTSGNFSRFIAGRHQLPSRHSFSAFQIVGAGHRWVCTRSADSVDVLDLYSGRELWSVNLVRPFNRAIATDDFVIVSSTVKPDVLCFDRHTGTPIHSDKLANFSANVVRNAGPLAVTWRSDKETKTESIEWINLSTGTAEMSISLADMLSFHFLDDRTLIGLNESQQFQTVDLVTGASDLHSYATDVPPQNDNVAKPETPTNGPPDLNLWDHRRVQVTSDPLNYYVSNRVGNKAVAFRQSFGRSSLRFEGDLRVIDRVTGEIRWVYRAQKAFVATTDQAELPFLAMWNDENQFMRMPGKGAKNLLHAYDKLTGKELFRQHVPSRYGWRFLGLDTPKTNVVDITVYGTRLRMIGQTPD